MKNKLLSGNYQRTLIIKDIEYYIQRIEYDLHLSVDPKLKKWCKNQIKDLNLIMETLKKMEVKKK